MCETALLTTIHEPKCLCPLLPVLSGKRNRWAEEKGECLALESVQHGLGTLGPWNDLRRGPLSCNVPKVMQGKTK